MLLLLVAVDCALVGCYGLPYAVWCSLALVFYYYYYFLCILICCCCIVLCS